MLEAIGVGLMVLWWLGLVSASPMGGYLHYVLALAVAVIVLRLVSGRSSN